MPSQLSKKIVLKIDWRRVVGYVLVFAAMLSSFSFGLILKQSEIKAKTALVNPGGADNEIPEEIAQAELELQNVPEPVSAVPVSLGLQQVAGVEENSETKLQTSNPAPVIEISQSNQQNIVTPYNLNVLVDKNHSLPPDFVANDLQSLQNTGLDIAAKGMRLRKETTQALLKLSNAMEKALGKKFVVLSAYRSYNDQASLYNQIKKTSGSKVEDRAALAGFSEHQLGTSVDLCLRNSKGVKVSIYPGKSTPEWRWLDAHAQEYGFVMSYRSGQTAATGYQFEPWHWRYVGVELARVIRYSKSAPQESYQPINT